MADSCVKVLADILFHGTHPKTDTIQRLNKADRRMKDSGNSLSDTVMEMKEVTATPAINSRSGRNGVSLVR